MKNLIQRINQAKIIQTACWEEQEFPGLLQMDIDMCRCIADGLEVDKHRWYETSISVYELDGEYFGIRYVTDIFSEQMGYSDILWKIKAFPMKVIITTTYIADRNI